MTLSAKESPMKKILLFCCLALLCACARQPVTEGGPDDQAALEQRWKHFAAQDRPQAPYRLHMSLRFGTEGDTRRVTALFWGNGERGLRLDVMAGVGAVMAKVLEDGQHFLAYSPGENTAYFYQGATTPLLQLGVPVPFTLSRLADLLNGRYPAAFGRSHTHAQAAAENKAHYDLDGKPGGRLTLNAAGLPVGWQEQASGTGWRMEIAYADDAPTLPSRLTLSHSNGKKAVLLVKQREAPAVPFAKEQMALPLPQGTPLLPLAKFKQR